MWEMCKIVLVLLYKLSNKKKTSLALMHTRPTQFHKMSAFGSVLCSVFAKFISALDELWTN